MVQVGQMDRVDLKVVYNSLKRLFNWLWIDTNPWPVRNGRLPNTCCFLLTMTTTVSRKRHTQAVSNIQSWWRSRWWNQLTWNVANGSWIVHMELYCSERKVWRGCRTSTWRNQKIQAATSIVRWCNTGPRMAFINQGVKNICIAYITVVQQVEENSKPIHH